MDNIDVISDEECSWDDMAFASSGENDDEWESESGSWSSNYSESYSDSDEREDKTPESLNDPRLISACSKYMQSPLNVVAEAHVEKELPQNWVYSHMMRTPDDCCLGKG